MKFTAELKDLIKVSSEASSIASSTGRDSYLYLSLEGNTLTAKARNTDRGFIEDLTVSGNTDGKAVVNAEIFNKAVSSLADGEVLIELKNDKLHVKQKDSHFRLALSDPESRFDIETPKPEDWQELPENFPEIVSRINYAATRDRDKINYQGISFRWDDKTLNMAASDGRIFALMSVDHMINLPNLIKGKREIVVREAYISYVAKKEVNRFTFKENSIWFTDGRRCFFFPLITKAFPDYTRIIEVKGNVHVTFDRKEFLDAVHRSVIMADEKAMVKYFKLRIKDNEASISAEGITGASSETIACVCSGEYSFFLSSKYITNILGSSKAERITYSFSTDGNQMIIITDGTVGWKTIMMPIIKT